MNVSKVSMFLATFAFGAALGLSACGGDDSSGDSASGGSAVVAANCAKVFSVQCDKYVFFNNEDECNQMGNSFVQNFPKCKNEYEASVKCSTDNMDPACVPGSDGKTQWTDKNMTNGACDEQTTAWQACMNENYPTDGE